MKAYVEEKPRNFHHFDLVITIETKEEAQLLHQMLCAYDPKDSCGRAVFALHKHMENLKIL